MLKALKKVGSKMAPKKAGDKESGDDKGWRLSDYDTNELIGKIYMFFEAQESGELRKGHRIKWRGPSYLNDGKKQGIDLTGGYHDAGDHLKLMFPLCWTMVQIAWSMHSGAAVLKNGTFDSQTNWHWSMQTLLHGLEFLFKCHLKPGVFVAQVGDVDCDHCECVRAEKDNITPRPVIVVSPEKPGADMLSVASAAFSSAHAVLKTLPEHEALAKQCLKHATQLYKEAKANPGIYSDSNPILAKTYKNDHWEQFAYLAAAWLYAATGDDTYLKEAQQWEVKSEQKQYWSDYSWGQVYFGATAVLYDCTGDAFYAKRLAYFADSHLNSKNGIKRTPCGLSFVTKWGSCRHAAGCAGILATYARGLLKKNPKSPVALEILNFAERQMSYMLGACGHSFVIGFGKKPPGKPHHRDSALKMNQSGDWEAFKKNTGKNPNQLVGGLCGGPLEDGSWVDDREDYVANEVALDYNAALLIGTVQCLVTGALKPAAEPAAAAPAATQPAAEAKPPAEPKPEAKPAVAEAAPPAKPAAEAKPAAAAKPPAV